MVRDLYTCSHSNTSIFSTTLFYFLGFVQVERITLESSKGPLYTRTKSHDHEILRAHLWIILVDINLIFLCGFCVSIAFYCTQSCEVGYGGVEVFVVVFRGMHTCVMRRKFVRLEGVWIYVGGGDFWAYPSVAKSNWLNNVIFWVHNLFHRFPYDNHWSVEHKPVAWNSTSSCVTSGASSVFEFVYGEDLRGFQFQLVECSDLLFFLYSFGGILHKFLWVDHWSVEHQPITSKTQ